MLIHAHLKRAAALALAMGAVTAGPAAARLNPGPSPQPPPTQATPATVSPQALALINQARYGDPAAQAASTAKHQVTTTPRVVYGIPRSSDSGFHWADAGIGAAGGLALSLIAIGGGLAATQRRRGNLPRSAVTA